MTMSISNEWIDVPTDENKDEKMNDNAMELSPLTLLPSTIGDGDAAATQNPLSSSFIMMDDHTLINYANSILESVIDDWKQHLDAIRGITAAINVVDSQRLDDGKIDTQSKMDGDATCVNYNTNLADNTLAIAAAPIIFAAVTPLKADRPTMDTPRSNRAYDLRRNASRQHAASPRCGSCHGATRTIEKSAPITYTRTSIAPASTNTDTGRRRVRLPATTKFDC